MEYDLICVGAGPVGSWLSWKMAAKGYKVIAIDAKTYEKVGTRFNPIHLDKLAFKTQGIPEPDIEAPVYGGKDREDALRIMDELGPMMRKTHPVDWDEPTMPQKMDTQEYIAHYTTSRFWGFDHSNPHVLELDICSLSFPLFVKRLHRLATESGVEFLYETEFSDFITCHDESGTPYVNGIIAKNKKTGDKKQLSAKITVDCTGWRSVARCALPEDIATDAHIETKPIEKEDLYTTYLQQWRSDWPLPQGLNTFTDYKGFVIQISPNEWTIGIGAPMPAKEIKKHQLAMLRAHIGEPVETGTIDTSGEDPRIEFAKSGGGIYDGNAEPVEFEREITAEHIGYVPAGRCSTKTLVANGFAVAGDSGYMNKPFNGEGMESGMWGAEILIDVLDKFFKDASEQSFGIPDKNVLWEYNSRYFLDIGAKLSEFNSTGRAITRFSEEDFNTFATALISEEDMQQLFHKNEMTLSVKMILKAVLLFSKHPALMIKILRKLTIAKNIKKLHKNYPADFAQFEKWLGKFSTLYESLTK